MDDCAMCGCTPDKPCHGGCGWDPWYIQQGVLICTRCAAHAAIEEEMAAPIIQRGDPEWLPGF